MSKFKFKLFKYNNYYILLIYNIYDYSFSNYNKDREINFIENCLDAHSLKSKHFYYCPKNVHT